MCNTYRITPQGEAALGVHGKVSATARKLPSPLVRKSGTGIVVLADEQVEIMRWGFRRRFNDSINNARADKLESGMWAKAFRERRCLIPMSAFYEWGPGEPGHKPAYEFREPGEDYLWVAGLWEPGAEQEPCYAMITTTSPPVMAPIHDRMPAVLAPDEAWEYLDREKTWRFRPFGGRMLVKPCESPLKAPRGKSKNA